MRLAKTKMKASSLFLLTPVCSTLCICAQDAPDILWQDAATYPYTITSVAVSPDGMYAASPGNNGIQIWRVADGAKIISLSHGYWVGNVAFSPDGVYLAIGGASPAVSVWRVSDWSLVYALTNDNNVSARPVAFSPDSSTLAVSSGYVIQLRSVTNGMLLHSWTNLFVDPYLGGIVALAFSPDGTKLASGAGYRGRDVNLRIWSVPSGELLLDVPTAQTYNVGFVAFSPDGQWMATAGGNLPYGPVQLWRAADGTLVRTIPGDAFSAVFSPDGAQMGVIGTDIAFYSVANGAVVRRYSDSANGSYYQKAMAITPDGSTFLRVCFPGKIFAARVPLWIHSIAWDGNRCVLAWSGGRGPYRLQRRTNASDTTWQNVGRVLSNKTVKVLSPLPSSFFRVIALPEEPGDDTR
jgi:WD40 repeat protein